MKKQKIHLTKQGFSDIQNELNILRGKRPILVKEIDHMRELGDLKENGAYEILRADLSYMDGRIIELEEILRHAVIIEEKDDGVIHLGSTVELHIENDKVHYQLVDETEADAVQGRVSIKSPIGKELVGKKVGDQVHVESPSGKITYLILNIK